MRKILTIFIILLIANIIFANQEFKTAARKTLVIDNTKGQIKYLYFTFTFMPKFYNEIFTDLYYEIEYEEIGTNHKYVWVNLYDGHLINLPESSYEWKGPFTGVRSIQYKFFFKLFNNPESLTEKSLAIHIFSTNPELDASYYNSFYEDPFSVIAYYYDLSTFKTVLKSYSCLSTIYAIYKVTSITTVNPPAFIARKIGENVAIYAIERVLDSIPITFEIICNSCGKKYTETKNVDFVFECNTVGCHNKAKIIFSR